MIRRHGTAATPVSLGTDVVSEVRRARPDPKVVRHPPGSIRGRHPSDPSPRASRVRVDRLVQRHRLEPPCDRAGSVLTSGTLVIIVANSDSQRSSFRRRARSHGRCRTAVSSSPLTTWAISVVSTSGSITDAFALGIASSTPTRRGRRVAVRRRPVVRHPLPPPERRLRVPRPRRQRPPFLRLARGQQRSVRGEGCAQRSGHGRSKRACSNPAGRTRFMA